MPNPTHSLAITEGDPEFERTVRDAQETLPEFRALLRLPGEANALVCIKDAGLARCRLGAGLAPGDSEHADRLRRLVVRGVARVARHADQRAVPGRVEGRRRLDVQHGGPPPRRLLASRPACPARRRAPRRLRRVDWRDAVRLNPLVFGSPIAQNDGSIRALPIESVAPRSLGSFCSREGLPRCPPLKHATTTRRTSSTSPPWRGDPFTQFQTWFDAANAAERPRAQRDGCQHRQPRGGGRRAGSS